MITTWGRFLAEKAGASHTYSCVLALLPEALAKKVMQWGKRKVPEKDIYAPEGREDEPHVTVFYGLHDTSAYNAIRLLQPEPSFKVALGRVSLFTNNPKYDVLKVEVISPKLHMLHKTIKRRMDNTENYPDYHPHVTVAYVKKGTCDHLAGNEDFREERFLVNELVFSSSDGEKTEIYLGF